jgi:hypothetical protein
MRPQLLPPPNQIEITRALRDCFQIGDITAAAIWRGDRDHTTLSKQLNWEEPSDPSLYDFARDLDAFYKTRYDLGASVWRLAEAINARYQQKPVEVQTFAPIAETFHNLNMAQLKDLPFRDRLRVAEQLHSELGKYIAGLRHLDIDEGDDEAQFSRPARAGIGR